jgi:antitoxin (DNA-binding transcriptional repressor) of toxin-antitoxin stability system
LQGEEVIIANAGKPFVKPVPCQPTRPNRIPGGYEGQFAMADDFDETPAI